jgi:Domain of unknown function (DUF4157)
MNHEADLRPDDESPRDWRDLSPAPTFGQRLNRQASELSIRHLPDFGWLRPFGALRERMAVRGQLSGDRFTRRELTAEETQAPARPMRSTFPAAERGQEVQPAVRQRLRDAVGPAAAEALRIHESAPVEGAEAQPAEWIAPAGSVASQPAERETVTPAADAVTVGRDVFFSPGRYQPHDPVGFGLLVHEATHVLHAMTPDAAWRRATAAGVRDEEQEATLREQQAVQMWQPLSLPAAIGKRGDQSRPITVAAETGATSGASMSATSAAARPMTAEPGRTAEPTTPAPPEQDLGALREQIYRDLLGRIRSDFERGA